MYTATLNYIYNGQNKLENIVQEDLGWCHNFLISILYYVWMNPCTLLSLIECGTYNFISLHISLIFANGVQTGILLHLYL